MKTTEDKGRTIRIAVAEGRDAQLKVLFQTVMPVAIDVYKKKCLELGNPRVPDCTFKRDRNKLLMSHADGYTNGFIDAVYFILTGKLDVAFCEREPDDNKETLERYRRQTEKFKTEVDDELVQQG